MVGGRTLKSSLCRGQGVRALRSGRAELCLVGGDNPTGSQTSSHWASGCSHRRPSDLSQDNFSVENMHSQWDPEIFPALVKRAPTIEEHAQLGYPTPTAPGHGVEINGARPPPLLPPPISG